MTFIEWCSSNGKIPYSLGLEGAYEAGQQSMQVKVEELQKRIDKAIEALKNKIEKVQKYEQDSFDHGAVMGLDSALRTVEQALKGGCRHESDGTNRLSLPPKTKCKKCGKFYSANVLKGDQYDEHRKKAEEAISKGASLTNHRIEL